MRATTLLAPRGKRHFWRINCYDTGTMCTSADIVTEAHAIALSAEWNSGCTIEEFKKKRMA